MIFTDTSTANRAESVGALQTAESVGPAEEQECYEQLLLLARRKTGAIPEELLVRHALAITPRQEGADWPVQKAVLEALLRRHSSSHKDELRPQTRPKRPFLGAHATRRKGKQGSPRPYTTVLTSVSPPAGSCDCLDFVKSSLGLCKHLFVLLENIYAHPERLRAALREQQRRAEQPTERLLFHPIRPFTGLGDWLNQVRWDPGAHPARRNALTTRLRRCFATDPSSGGRCLVLAQTWPHRPQRRLSLIRDLSMLREQLAEREQRAEEDPALRLLLEMERARLQRQLAGVSLGATSVLTGLLAELKQPLYPYQVEGVQRFLLSGGRLLLGDDMGLGKTAQAIASCHVLWQAGKVRKGLITVPSSLKGQWLREWRLFSDAPVAVVEGSPAERATTYQKTAAGFLIVSYEQVLRDLPLIHAFAPQLVVLDEAQRIKNWETKTAAYVKTLEVPYRLVLTGTPMENRLDELASLLEWVDSLAIEPKWRLGPWHAQHGAQGVIGARHLDTLRLRLSGCMLRRVRKDILRQLPARTDNRVPVELTPQQREEHDALNQPIAQLIAILRKRPLSPAQHLRLMSLLTAQRIICNGLAQLRFAQVWPTVRALPYADQTVRDGLFSPKLSVLRDLITQLVVDQGRKVVVFSQWRRMLKLAEWAVRDILAPMGARAVFFTGGQSESARTQAIVEFHDRKEVPVMFLTDAGGVGLNLQRAASACINLELPWNPAVLEQRISRIYRIGQTQPIDVYNLITDEGIEARITDLVANKKALFTGLFEGTADQISFERSGSLLARIEQLIAPATELLAQGSVPDSNDEVEEPFGLKVDELLGAADEARDEPEDLVAADQAALPAEAEAAIAAIPELSAEAAAAGAQAEAAIPATAPITAVPSLALEPEADLASLPPRAPDDAGAPPLFGEALRHLLADVKIHPSAGGGLTIEATPAAAATLATLFNSLASMLQAAARSDSGAPGVSP